MTTALGPPTYGVARTTTLGRWSPLGAWTVAIFGMALIIAADFAWRNRDQTASLTGAVDISVLIEFAIYAVVGCSLLLRLFDFTSFHGIPRSLMVGMWSFTAFMCVTTVFSPYPSLAITRASQLLVTALLATVIARAGQRAELHRFMHLYLLVAVAVIPLGLALQFPRTPEMAGRFRWLYVHPVIAANFLGLAVVIGAAYLLDRHRLADVRRWHRFAYPIALLFTAAGLLATRTRGALAATLIALVVIIAVSRPARRIDTALIAAAGVVVLVALVGSELVTYIARGEGTEQLGTLNSRTDVWDQALELIGMAPYAGHGFMAARGLFLERFGLGGAHNAAMEVLVNAGIVGFAFWLAMLATVLAAARRAAHAVGSRPLRPDSPLICGLLTFLVVNAISTGQLGQAANAQNVVFFVVIGWLGALPRWAAEGTG